MDEDIQRLRRAAERTGPTPFLLGLCDPGGGHLLQAIGAKGRARLLAMIDYVDRTAGARRLTLVRVQDHDGEGRDPFLLLRDLASGQLHELSLCRDKEPVAPAERRAHEAVEGFVNLLRVQGADPGRCETWRGKEVLVHRRACWAPTFAAQVAWTELQEKEGRPRRPPRISLEPVELEELLEHIDELAAVEEPWAEPLELDGGDSDVA
jgi:hypothetical protein